MLKLAHAIDAISIAIGKFAAWGLLFAILFAVYNALVRKFAISLYSNSVVDAQWMLFSFTFLMCASWTMQRNEHIRIDILNAKFSHKTRIWIDIVGHSLILLPFCIAMVYISAPWFWKSFIGNEQGPNVGGLPFWLAKAIVPMAFTLLGLQTISELIKRFAVLGGKMDDSHAHGGHSVNATNEELKEVEHV